MIKIYTRGEPDERIKDYAAEIFGLEEKRAAYNLPLPSHPQKDLFEKLFQLGVVQIIHDGKADEIRCINGYTSAINRALGNPNHFGEIITISRQYPL
jgi:hypothetical protein